MAPSPMDSALGTGPLRERIEERPSEGAAEGDHGVEPEVAARLGAGLDLVDRPFGPRLGITAQFRRCEGVETGGGLKAR